MGEKSPIDELPEPQRSQARRHIAGSATDGWICDEQIVADALRDWIDKKGPEKCALVRERVRSRLSARGLLEAEYGNEHSAILHEELTKVFPKTSSRP